MDMNLGETHFNLLQVVNGLVSDMASPIRLCKSLLHPLRREDMLLDPGWTQAQRWW